MDISHAKLRGTNQWRKINDFGKVPNCMDKRLHVKICIANLLDVAFR